MPRYRNWLGKIWTNFLGTFKVAPRQYFGELKGEDHLGNRYFELGADPQGGRRKSTRWFEGPDPTDTTPEVPREWQVWLRRQRDTPPTQDEIIRNMAQAKLKQKNAAKIDEKFGTKGAKPSEPTSGFPTYPEYRNSPGVNRD